MSTEASAAATEAAVEEEDELEDAGPQITKKRQQLQLVQDDDEGRQRKKKRSINVVSKKEKEEPQHEATSSSSSNNKNNNNNNNITIDDFEHYINFRILDSIAYPGTYKKFMLARKEQDAPWAVEMAARVQTVQSAIHDLEQKGQDLRTSPLSALHIVWVHVTESTLPPSDLQLTIANCAISRKTAVPCVVIKGKGRGAQPFTVNSRFASFIYDLWVIHKMDMLVKTFARRCMEEIDPESKLPMAGIVDAFKVIMICHTQLALVGNNDVAWQAKQQDIRHLASSFYMAYMHVYRSAVSSLRSLI